MQLRKSGRSWVGLCPFHHEKTPSFHVEPQKGLYYCFGCKAGGDVFDFVMKMEGLTFREALAFLAEKAGLEMSSAKESKIRRKHVYGGILSKLMNWPVLSISGFCWDRAEKKPESTCAVGDLIQDGSDTSDWAMLPIDGTA